jgi:LysR family pca operon transcriptional activator
MLHGTDMISVMPRLMMAGDLLRGTLKLVPLPVAAPPRPAGLILRPDRPLSPAGQAFVRALQAYVSEVGAITEVNRSNRRSDTTATVPSA